MTAQEREVVCECGALLEWLLRWERDGFPWPPGRPSPAPASSQQEAEQEVAQLSKGEGPADVGGSV